MCAHAYINASHSRLVCLWITSMTSVRVINTGLVAQMLKAELDLIRGRYIYNVYLQMFRDASHSSLAYSWLCGRHGLVNSRTNFCLENFSRIPPSFFVIAKSELLPSTGTWPTGMNSAEGATSLSPLWSPFSCRWTLDRHSLHLIKNSYEVANMVRLLRAVWVQLQAAISHSEFFQNKVWP